MDSSFVRRVLGRAAILALMVGCGSTSPGIADDGGPPADATMGPDAGGGDAGVTAHDASGATCPSVGDASTVAPGRVPEKHRSAGVACPTQRAAVTTAACGCPDGGLNAIVRPDGSACLCGACAQDSDCDAGVNGRCGELGPIAYLQCSYDECTADKDCGRGVPCECRATALAANTCQKSSLCAVDSDCGPGGYCSPSLVGNLCECPSTALCGDSGAECTANGVSVPCSCGDSCAHGYFCHTPCDTCLDDRDCGGRGTCNYDTVDQRWECKECWPVP